MEYRYDVWIGIQKKKKLENFKDKILEKHLCRNINLELRKFF